MEVEIKETSGQNQEIIRSKKKKLVTHTDVWHTFGNWNFTPVHWKDWGAVAEKRTSKLKNANLGTI
jgi:hypothetical protein